MNTIRRTLLLLLSLLPLVFCVSCIGQRQINTLAIVTAVGIEKGTKPGDVKIAVQIIRPADARGQTGAPSGGVGQPIYSAEAEGQSLFDAIRNLGRFVSRRVYWAHNFLIVVCEDYAKEGIEDMVDFFTRNHELRMNTWVAVTSKSPGELISTITGIEVVPGDAVDRLFLDNEVVGQAPASNMMHLEEAFLSPSAQPVLARLELTPRGISNKKPEEHGSVMQVELAGAAAFKDGKMAGWLTPSETRALLFFTERLDTGIEVVACPANRNRATVEFRNARMRVKPGYVNGLPRFDIRLSATADIVESDCGKSISEIREEVENELNDKLKGEIQSLLDKTQQVYRTDVMKLGDLFRNRFPLEWRTVGSKWDEMFAEADIDVTVRTNIRSGVVKAVRDAK